MNLQRITVSLPDYLYQQLIALAPSRKVSAFVAEAIEAKVCTIDKNDDDPVASFFALRDKLPKKKLATIMKAIHRGRK